MAKTIQEVYGEVVKNKDMMKEFIAANNDGKIAEFAKKYDCDATAEEINAFLTGKLDEGKELSVDELEQVAGGSNPTCTSTCPNCGWSKTTSGRIVVVKCPNCGTQTNITFDEGK